MDFLAVSMGWLSSVGWSITSSMRPRSGPRCLVSSKLFFGGSADVQAARAPKNVVCKPGAVRSDGLPTGVAVRAPDK